MKKQTTVVCLGDSSIRWWEVEDKDLWPAVLERSLRKEGLDAYVINSGIPGDCTVGMVGRFYNDVVRHNPDYVIISGGGNDMWWNVPPSIARANIYAMIKYSLHYNIIPILGIFGATNGETVTYMQYDKVWQPEHGFKKFQERYQQLAQSYVDDIAKVCNLLFIDFREKISTQFYDAEKRPIKKYFCPDGLHLSVEGNRVLGEAAAEFLKTLPKHQGVLRT